MPSVKKNKLTPTRYDEVSLVDVGAAEDALVVIAKLGISKDLTNVGDLHVDVPISLRAAPRRKKKKVNGVWVIVKAQSTPPKKTAPANKTAAKKGTSQRAQDWNSSRHPRAAPGSAMPNRGGTFTTTSSESKKKYGNNGTTLEQMVATAAAEARARIARDGGDKKKKKTGTKKAKTSAGKLVQINTIAAGKPPKAVSAPKKKVPIAVHKSFAATLLHKWIEGKVTP